MRAENPLWNGPLKIVQHPNYNYIFNSETGLFLRWGETHDEDPPFSPLGPEIIDIEVSTICERKCPWCYKSNTAEGKNMKFETFKMILDRIPKNLTQMAFGVGDLDANPDLWKMFQYCLKRNVIPNITINGMRINPNLASKLAKYCGAIAVSHYNDEVCFDAVKILKENGVKQINIHKLIAKETLKSSLHLIKSLETDKRLNGLNALLFLSLKQKGRGRDLQPLTKMEFSKLINFALEKEILFGLDSCSAIKFLDLIKGKKEEKVLRSMVEPCEGACFSYYVNVDGKGYPCSFLENDNSLQEIDLLNINDFLNTVWFGSINKKFREKLIENERICPRYQI